MGSKVKIPYAYNKDGKTVYITDVPHGKKCNAFCPACDGPLIAKNGEYKNMVKHFAHYNDRSDSISINCVNAYETSLHLGAKEIIKKYNKIYIPTKFYGSGKDKDLPLIEEGYYSIKNVRLERKYHDIIPDVIVEWKEGVLLFEIFVSNKISHEKLNKIQKNNVSVIEIDLSRIDRNTPIDDDLIKQYVIDGKEDVKKWIHLADIENIRNRIKKSLGFNENSHQNFYPNISTLSKARFIEENIYPKYLLKEISGKWIIHTCPNHIGHVISYVRCEQCPYQDGFTKNYKHVLCRHPENK